MVIFSGTGWLGQLHQSKVHHIMDVDSRKLHHWSPLSGFQSVMLLVSLHLPTTVVCS